MASFRERRTLRHPARLVAATYLAALLTLLANDFLLKRVYGGALTGKLSDFAGLFAFALFAES